MKQNIVNSSLCVILFYLIINSAQSAQIVVDTNEFSSSTNNNCSLGEAVLSADFDISFDQCVAGSGDDVITFTPSLFDNFLNTMIVGVTSTMPVFQKSLDIQVPAGKALSLLGNDLNPIFSINLDSGSSFSINNTVINNGFSTTAGGAMQFSGEASTINLTNVSFSNNHSEGHGGAIGFDRDISNTNNVTLNIINGYFNGNSSDLSGGAIYAPDHITLEISNTDFIGNSAVEKGAGISTSWLANISDSLFDGGLADLGGGIYSGGNHLNVFDSVFQNNQGVSFGGAIRKYAYSSETFDKLTFKRNTVINNFSAGSAGLDLGYVHLIASNNLIANNTSSLKTGGLSLFLLNADDGDHEVHLIGNTFFHNVSNGSDSNAINDFNIYFSANNSSFIGNAFISDPSSSQVSSCKLKRSTQIVSAHNLSDTSQTCLVGNNNQIFGIAQAELLPTTGGFHPFEVLPQPGSQLIDGWLGSDCVDHNGIDIEVDLNSDRRLFGNIYDGDADGSRDCDIGSSEVDEGANVTIVVTGAGAGLVTSTPSGITCNPDCNLAFPVNSEVTLTASATAGSQFVGWSGGDCNGISSCTFTVSNNVSIQAEFQPTQTFELSVTKTGDGNGFIASTVSGISCGGLCNANFEEASVITLVASAGSNSQFIGWSGDCVVNGLECTVTLNGDTVIQAQFDSLTQRLEVSVTGIGTGLVNSSPTGIDCPSDCSEDFADDSVVTLSFTPDLGTTFSGWSGDCSGTGDCIITMSQARDVAATTDVLHNLSVTSNEFGLVSSQPIGISCPSDCEQDYSEGDSIELTHLAITGAHFVEWTGDCSGIGTCQVHMTQDRQVTAVFEADNHQLTINSSQGGSVTSMDGGIDCGIDCDELYAYDTTVHLTAVAENNYDFIGWSGGGTCNDASLSCEITITQSSTVNALFETNDIVFTNGFEEL
jgi:predicted outer membrane repeat protein